MKRPGQLITLRYTSWTGPLPNVGDCLRTTTGRMYEIYSIRGCSLRCRVLASGSRLADGATVFNWVWSVKRKSA